MGRITFNDGWSVCRLGEDGRPVGEDGRPTGGEKPVRLPHDAMLGEKRGPESAGAANIGWFVGGDYRYRKAFEAPAEWRGQCVLLEFEGVYHEAEVRLNGELLATQHNGYLPFFVDVSQAVRYGETNELEVVARNAAQPNSRWYSGTGIYRPVWAWVLPPEHLEPRCVRVSTLDVDEPRVRVELEANFDGPAAVQVLDGAAVVAEAEAALLGGKAEVELALPAAELWSPESPKLYRCRVSAGADVRDVDFGIRRVEVDAAHGLRINGERVILRGACVHHDNGLLGAAAHPFAEARKLRLLKEAGYNAVRSSHNHCSEALLAAADHLGMLVVDEYADMWYIHKTAHDYASYLPTCWENDLRTLVGADFNHPSMIMYSLGNEVSETAQPRGVELVGRMQDLLHVLDPTRPVTCGVNIFFNFLSSMGFGVYSDKNAEKEAKAAQKRKDAGKAHKAVGSEFFNNLAGLLGSGFMKWGATLHGSDVKTRDAFAVLDVAGYNYGINRYEHDLKAYPNRVILGSETFCSDAARFWDLAQANPALIGDFVWSGMDYIGECGIGAWEYADYAPEFEHGPGWLTAGAGRLDVTGRAYGEAAYTQVAFGLSTVRIGVVPADHAGERHSPSAWRMSNTFESWTWPGCEGKKTQVEVYARAARVELLLNGRLLGEKRPGRDCRAAFAVAYAPGTLEAVAYDESGAELGRASLVSGTGEARLVSEPEQPRVGADDLVYVRLRYATEDGRTQPLARGRIAVEVEGGELLGLGHACPYNEDGYLQLTTDTYYGEALAIVRPSAAGTLVRVRATSLYGAAEAEVTVG